MFVFFLGRKNTQCRPVSQCGEVRAARRLSAGSQRAPRSLHHLKTPEYQPRCPTEAMTPRSHHDHCPPRPPWPSPLRQGGKKRVTPRDTHLGHQGLRQAEFCPHYCHDLHHRCESCGSYLQGGFTDVTRVTNQFSLEEGHHPGLSGQASVST